MEKKNKTDERIETGTIMNVSHLSALFYRRSKTLSLDNDLIVLEKVHSLFDKGKTFRLNHVCVAVVLQGEADILIDGKTYHVSKRDMFVIIQQQEVRVMSQSEDFQAHILLMSRAYIDNLDLKNTYQMFLKVRQEPAIHPDKESLTTLLYCFGMIINLLRHQNNPYQRQTIYHAIKAYMYWFAYYFRVSESRPQNNNEKVCLQFMNLLEKFCYEQHSVAFYAEQMCLTPRYVSACVKAVTGKTAFENIAEQLLQHAYQKLLYSDLTISQISYALGFSNPSAFGKFFRMNEGMGPREWKKKNMAERSKNNIPIW